MGKLLKWFTKAIGLGWMGDPQRRKEVAEDWKEGLDSGEIAKEAKRNWWRLPMWAIIIFFAVYTFGYWEQHSQYCETFGVSGVTYPTGYDPSDWFNAVQRYEPYEATLAEYARISNEVGGRPLGVSIICKRDNQRFKEEFTLKGYFEPAKRRLIGS